jgi:serine/threonine protein kinase
MNTERFEQIQNIFHEARVLGAVERLGFLDRVCAGDSALRQEVISLLDTDATDDSEFMDKPLFGAGLRAIDGESALPGSIGRYRIIGPLGEGGMGIVFKAEQPETGSIVALKIIRTGFTSRELLRRFEHEAHVLGRLSHPGIARVLEAGLHNDNGSSIPFIAMEFVEGPTLVEYVRREEPGMHEILELIAMICDAVQHAHQKGVIHRDLKPGNILVEKSGNAVQPKILDFGIARVTEADTLEVTRQTHTGQLIGTIRYMSPEQAAGDPAAIDTRSDVYALGVILYELLARRPPYSVDHRLIHEAVRVIREDEAEPLSAVNRAYRGDLTTILGKALEKDKTRRYQSASEFAADIRRHLSDIPISAHPPSAVYLFRKFARRNRGVVIGAIAVIVLLVSGIIATSWQAAAASRARASETIERERAEHRFNEVRDLARWLIFDFDDRINRLAGSTPAREQLVNQALRYLSSVSEDVEPDDLQMQRELGNAYFKLGHVQGHPTSPNLGDPDGAIRSYETGLRFHRAVAMAQPDSIDDQRALAESYNRLGFQIMYLERFTEAREYFERAIEILERIDMARPDEPDIARARGDSYGSQSRVQMYLGNLEDSLHYGNAQLEQYRRAIALQPDYAQNRFLLASAQSGMAEILDTQGDTEGAMTRRRACLVDLESLTEDEPNDILFRRNLGLAVERVGWAYQQAGELETAIPYFLRAAGVADEVLRIDPNFEIVRFDRIRALSHMGEAQLALGRTSDAEATLRTHMAMCAEYLRRNPDDPGAQRQEGVAYYKMGEIEATMARLNEASSADRTVHLRESLSWQRRCLAVFVGMRERGVLAPTDSAVPDEIAMVIAGLESELGLEPEHTGGG